MKIKSIKESAKREGSINDGIKVWYKKNYPEDELADEIDDKITFKAVASLINSNGDFYDAMGVADSLVRERVFEEIANRLGIDYGAVYDAWLRPQRYQIPLDESLAEVQDDFRIARRNYGKYGFSLSFEDALELFNDKSKLAEPDSWYAKPIYSKEAWADMISLARESDYEQVVDVDEGVEELTEATLGNGRNTYYLRYYDKPWEYEDDDDWSDDTESSWVIVRANSKEEAEQILRDTGITGNIDIFESLKNKKTIKESRSISDEDFQEKLKKELSDAVKRHYKKFGYTDREIEHFIMPVYSTKLRKGYGDDGSDALFVWVGAEVDYEELEELANVLNRVIRKYDKEAYFEPETTGRLVAVLWS